MVANWSTAEDGARADFSVHHQAPERLKPARSTPCADRRGFGNATVTTRPVGQPNRPPTSDELKLRGDLAHEMLGAEAIPCKHSARLDEDTPWRLRRSPGARL